MIYIKYKDDLTKSEILPHKNILSWKSKNKEDNLPIIEMTSKSFFYLWWKSLWNKIYFLTCSNKTHDEWSYEFFKIPNKK